MISTIESVNWNTTSALRKNAARGPAFIEPFKTFIGSNEDKNIAG